MKKSILLIVAGIALVILSIMIITDQTESFVGNMPVSKDLYEPNTDTTNLKSIKDDDVLLSDMYKPKERHELADFVVSGLKGEFYNKPLGIQQKDDKKKGNLRVGAFNTDTIIPINDTEAFNMKVF
jgi:hypothetical protein